MARYKRVLVPELNNGQLAQLAYMVAGVQLQNVARRSNGVATAITGT